MENSTYDDRLEEDFQWPEVGDTLFSQGQPVNAAFLEDHPDFRSYHMARGYKLAADLLVGQAEARRFSGRRQLIYPLVFCYRHFLELTLKTLLAKYGPMANIELDRKDHELESLWRDFRKLLDNLNLDEEPEKQTNAIIERCVAEFAMIDPESQSFRYPTRKNGQPFKPVPDSIDLSRLHGTMQKIDTYFGCVGSELYRIEEDRSTMLAMWY